MSEQPSHESRPARVLLVKVGIIVSIVLLMGLAIAFAYDSRVNNELVAALRAHEAGTPFSAIVAAHGPPDRVDKVHGTWRWGRRMHRPPEGVTHVAVYTQDIVPQVCAFLLDVDERVIEVWSFADYPTAEAD